MQQKNANISLKDKNQLKYANIETRKETVP